MFVVSPIDLPVCLRLEPLTVVCDFEGSVRFVMSKLRTRAEALASPLEGNSRTWLACWCYFRIDGLDAIEEINIAFLLNIGLLTPTLGAAKPLAGVFGDAARASSLFIDGELGLLHTGPGETSGRVDDLSTQTKRVVACYAPGARLTHHGPPKSSCVKLPVRFSFSCNYEELCPFARRPRGEGVGRLVDWYNCPCAKRASGSRLRSLRVWVQARQALLESGSSWGGTKVR